MKRGFLLKAQAKKAKRNAHNEKKAQATSVASVTKAMEGASIGEINLVSAQPGNEAFFARNMPFGKIDEADKLTTDERSKYTAEAQADTGVSWYSHEKTDYPEGLLIATTIPALPNGSNGDPDGNTEWLVRGGSTKAKVLNAPGYPSPVPKPARSNLYEIKNTDDMGLGVFATCDIQQGDLIFAERPLIVIPITTMTLDDTFYRLQKLDSDLSPAKRMQYAMADWDRQIQFLVNRLRGDRKKAFMELQNSHTEDGSPPTYGIVRTNAYGLADSLYDGPDGVKRTESEQYSAVCEIGSRINHSCIPNVSHTFSLSSFSMQFYATADIKKGDQLFYAYCGILDSADSRRAQLIRYGVVCKCLACENATPESDKFRQEFAGLAAQGSEIMMAFTRCPTEVPEFVIQNEMNKLLKLHERAVDENIPANEYVRFILHLALGWKLLGNLEESQRFKDMVMRLPDMTGDYSFYGSRTSGFPASYCA